MKLKKITQLGEYITNMHQLGGGGSIICKEATNQ